MKPLCSHLLGAEAGSFPFRERLILDYYDGLAVGIVSCADCDATYVLELLDWDQGLRRRVFRLATISREIVAEYEVKGGRATCKLESGQLELEALLSQREATRTLFALDVDGLRLIASASLEGVPIPTGPWGELREVGQDERWFGLLGLTKER